MTQDENIAPQLGRPVDLLQETLVSHRLALSINESNADALFNTAQVLVSLAEALADEDPSFKVEAIKLLQDAIEMFSSCLTRQELEYFEIKDLKLAASKEMQANFDPSVTPDPITIEQNSTRRDSIRDKSAPNDLKTPDAPSKQTESVIEASTPVTATDLLETVQAELGALATLVSLYSPDGGTAIETLKELVTPLIAQKIPSYLSLDDSLPPGVQDEDQISLRPASVSSEIRDGVHLAIAHWESSLANAQYRSGSIDVWTYADRLDQAFVPYLDLSKPWTPTTVRANSSWVDLTRLDPLPCSVALYPFADALIDFVGASSDSGRDVTPALSLAALTEACMLLLAAAQYAASHYKPRYDPRVSKGRIWLLLGDAALQQLRIASPPEAPAELTSYRAAMALKAQNWFYAACTVLEGSAATRDADGSLTIKVKTGAEMEMEMEAKVKAAVSYVLRREVDVEAEGSEELKEGIRAVPEQVLDKILADMIDDGLVSAQLDILKAKLLA